MRTPLLLLSVAWLVLGSGSLQAARPTISSPSASKGPNGTATVTAEIEPGRELTTVTVRYGTTTSYGSVEKGRDVRGDDGPTEVSVPLEGLVGGKQYNIRIVAENASSRGNPVVSGNLTVTPDPYAPTIVLSDETNARGREITLNAVVTPNRGSGEVTAYFEYGTTESLLNQRQPAAGFEKVIDGGAVKEKVSVDLKELDRDKQYFYRLVVAYGAAQPQRSDRGDFKLTNNAPVAVDDLQSVDGRSPVIIAVLANDKDRDDDRINIVDDSVEQGEHGRAARTGRTITYTPSESFSGVDEFEYTIEDVYGATSTAVVKIRSPKTAISGLRGGLISDGSGKSVGYLRLQGSSSGSFTGKVELDGKSYTLLGRIDAQGRFEGTAHGDDGSIDVEFTVDQETGTTLTASLGDGEYSIELGVGQPREVSLAELEGRYTVDFPSGSGSVDGSADGADSLPGGIGWASIEIDEDGSASIKGKLGDGRGYSAQSVVMQGAEGPILPIYTTAESSVIVGTLTLGETIGGTIDWFREESDATFYGDGFGTTIAATGGRYLPPDDGRRALEIGEDEVSDVTFSLSGGNLPSAISVSLRVSEDDDVEVLGDNFEDLKVEIDRRSGIFEGEFDHPDGGDRRRFTGVLLQQAGTGRGVFFGKDRTGRVEFTPQAPTTPEPPNPEPTTPLPTVPLPTVPDPITTFDRARAFRF